MKNTIRVALAGVGNCASSLVQGVRFYRKADPGQAVPGLMHVELGGYHPRDIVFSAAFDVAKSKVGRDLGEAIFAPPNNTFTFSEVPKIGVRVSRGPTFDGLGKYLTDAIEESRRPAADVAAILRESKTDVLINYLPVGSEKAAMWYAEEALKAGCAFINCIPVFIASRAEWRKKFERSGLPLIGDDIKSQVGATIVHRVLTDLFGKRGVRLDRTYQLNFGGNTDFMNMLERERLESKKISKTQAVTSQLQHSLAAENIHVGPSDYVPWLQDRKWCYIRMEGTTFGNVPLNCEVKLEVWDSPNSAGVVIDAIRCAKLALDRGIGGVLTAPAAYFMKSPPKQYGDAEAHQLLETFIASNQRTTRKGSRMKLVIFGLSISSSWGNGHATLWRGLCREFILRGHTVTFYERDVPYYESHRDLQEIPGGRLVLYPEWEQIQDAVAEELKEADVGLVTSYCPDALAALDLLLDSPVMRVFYDLDTPVTLAARARGEEVSYIGPDGLAPFDLVLSFTGGWALELLESRLRATSVQPLYGSVDLQIHHPVPPEMTFQADLSYLGTYAPDRQEALSRLFLDPARQRPHQRFVLAGAMYPQDFPWTSNLHFVRHLPPCQHAGFFSSSRFTLNVTRRAMAELGYCPSGRLFEAAACGVPILSDNWMGLDSFFEPEEEILVVNSTSDVLDALNLPDSDRREIAERARSRVLGEHTAGRRAAELEEALMGNLQPVEET